MTKKITALLTLGFCFSLLPLSLSAQDYVIPANTPSHIRLAVENAQRSMEDTQRDVIRKPAEVLTLADLNVGDHVIELSALGQYYSNILVQAIGQSGRLDMYDLPPWQRFGADVNGMNFSDAYSNTSYTMTYYHEADYDSNVDAVFNILSYHDLPFTGVDTAAMNARLFAALRSGGKYVIIDHKAEDGTGWTTTEALHRVDPQVIIDEVTAAGFVLVSNSSLLANPSDDKSSTAFSAGGNTDRAVFVFQKP